MYGKGNVILVAIGHHLVSLEQQTLRSSSCPVFGCLVRSNIAPNATLLKPFRLYNPIPTSFLSLIVDVLFGTVASGLRTCDAVNAIVRLAVFRFSHRSRIEDLLWRC